MDKQLYWYLFALWNVHIFTLEVSANLPGG